MCIFVSHVASLIQNVMMMDTLSNLVMVSVAITFVAVISMSRLWSMIMNGAGASNLKVTISQ